MTDLSAALSASASGLRAQTTRMRLAAENIANANSTALEPGGDPYRRRAPYLETEVQRATGAVGVRVAGAWDDPSAFRVQFDPEHPAADDAGMVKLPNVSTVVEMMDIRDAARTYEANLSMIETARTMTSRALDLLRR
jgi:flagellar basal-body rod protein FlgC